MGGGYGLMYYFNEEDAKKVNNKYERDVETGLFHLKQVEKNWYTFVD